MKRHTPLFCILFAFALLLPQLAFADIAPLPDEPQDSESDDNDCSASPLANHTANWSILLALMVAVGAISFGAISRMSKKA